jgi:Domain of unknown function (DUF4276)
VTEVTIGLIFECGPQGADKQVCEYLVKQLKPGVNITSVTLDNKDNLLRDAGKVAAQMHKDGCACVLIVWDLRPAWPDMKNKPCRHDERQALLKNMAEAGLAANAPVYLVCVEQELESWLLASDHAIAACLSTAAHAYSVGRVKGPDAVPQPKAALIKHFKDARNWRYDDKVDAIRVLKAADVDLKRLRRSVSFARFEGKLNNCV